MSNPIIFNRGVKYIKLAKFDTGSTSENLTTQLGEINTIRVNYSDKGIVEYPVASIVEHETYYLYRVATTDATSSADNKQLDYNFLGFKTSSQTFDLGQTGIGNYDQVISSDSLGYFNFSSGLYTYGDTPNKTLRMEFTASLTLTPGSLSNNNQVTGSINLRKAGAGNIATVNFNETALTTPESFIVKGAGPVFRPIDSEIYNFRINLAETSSNGGPLTLELTDFKFKLLTGSAYTTSTGTQLPVVLEPFFTEPFYNGDYDVLVNNAPNARRSNLFFDVDHSSNIIQAVNQQILISSSQQGRLGAPYARIQDYNYYIDRSLTPRYKGSKSTSPGFNLSSNEGGLGILPNVEQLNVAAYSINWAGGTSPEILGAGGTSLSDILLVGDNRDDITIIPQADPNYSDIINSSVEPGDIVSFYQYGNSSAQNPQRVEVIETKLNVPPISAYMISRANTSSSKEAKFTTDLLGENGIIFSSSGVFDGGIYTVGTNNEGFYITGSFISGSDFTSEFLPRFNTSENEWYVTVYNRLGSPVVYDGPTSTKNYEFTSDFTTSDPLGYYGVAKITGVVNGTAGLCGITLDRDLTNLNNVEIGGDKSNRKGILIWESWGNSIIVRGSNLSGVGASLVYSEYAHKTLTDNLDYISRTYTNKS